MTLTEKIKRTFIRFAEDEAHRKSPLYEAWCYQITEHEYLLSVISHIPATQPKPNLFFASVQFLAFQFNHSFRHFFEAPHEVDYEESFSQLVQFCEEFEAELIQLLKSNRVQTNEVRRANFLYPLFAEIAHETKQSLTLIEIGTSAGLLLNVDQFRYKVEQNPPLHFGNTASAVTLHAKNLGEPIAITTTPIIQSRYGIDLNILDLENQDQFAWLKSLIWPEDIDRKELLEQVKEVHFQCNKQLINGDFRKLIPQILEEEAVKGSQIVIFHTFVANQFSAKLKEDLLNLLNDLSYVRPIYHIYNNMYDIDLHMELVKDGQTITKKVLQNMDSHGRHYHWKN